MIGTAPTIAHSPVVPQFVSFPKQYREVAEVHGIEIVFRSIQPEDETLLLEFHKTLSDQSVHFRYFGTVTLRQRTMHQRLRRHCSVDHRCEFALVADCKDQDGVHQILGVARLFKHPRLNEAEFAIVISDSWQGKGLGTHLLKFLVQVGRDCHLRRIIGRILTNNCAMIRVSRKAGFALRFDSADGEFVAEVKF